MNPRDPVHSASAWLDQLSRADAQQRVLRLAAVAGTLLFLPVLVAAGGGPLGAGSLVVAVVGLSLLLLPDSHAPLAWALLAAGLWAVRVPQTLSAWTLVAAADLLLVHLACTMACYGPAELALPRPLVRAWVGRAAVMLAVTTLLWLAARLLAVLDLPGDPWALSVALVVVAAWPAYLLPRLLARDGTGAAAPRS